MPNTTEVVLIEFQSDTTGLQSAEDRLLNMGKIDQKSASIYKATNDQLRQRVDLSGKLALSVTKEQEVFNKLVSSLKTLSGESKKAVESLLKLSAKEIMAGFDKAAISVEDYLLALQQIKPATEGVDKASNSLTQRLRLMVQQLAQLKLEGKDNTAQFRALAQEAGQLRGAMANAGKEVRNFASDTRTIDNVIGSVQALAGGFAIAQGAAALFGDSSEELQETLLKVNAAMAITQGLQQVSNALQKEGALSMLATSAATRGAAASQALYTFVVGTSTGALKAFRIALAATGIGLIVIALAALIANFDKVKTALSGISESQKEVLDNSIKNADAESEKLTALTEQDNILKLQGKTEKEILGLKIKQVDAVIESRQQQLLAQGEILKTQLIAEKKNREILTGIINFLTFPLNAIVKVVEGVASLLGKELNLPSVGDALAPFLFDEVKAKAEGEAAAKELEKQLADLKNQRAGFVLSMNGIDRKATEDRNKAAKEASDKRLADELASLETQLLNAERYGQYTIDLQKQIIDKKAAIELNAEGVTDAKKRLILTKAETDKMNIVIENNKKISSQAIADQISLNNAVLAQLNISEKEKLDLILENILLAAQEEANAADGNASKIKGINAKRDADIKAARLKSIEDTLERELELEKLNNADITRELQKIASNRNASLFARLNAIDELTNKEVDAVQKRVDALNEEFRKKLIAEADYNLKLAKLVEERKKILAGGEKAKVDTAADDAAAIESSFQQASQQVLDIAQQTSGLINNLFAFEADKENQRIAQQRKRVEELRESGKISEKEAIDRLKQIDREERKVRRQQAQRDKEAALFSAFINTSQAVIKAYATVGPIAGIVMAALVGGIGLIQIGLIANRKIPEFFKGKKDRYEGPGKIGERGSELWETNGQMYVARKPTIVWLGKSDKVYNPKETKDIMNRSLPTVSNKIIVNGKDHKAQELDYDKLGKAIGKYTSTRVDIDGYRDFIKEQQSFTTYLNNRRGY